MHAGKIAALKLPMKQSEVIWSGTMAKNCQIDRFLCVECQRYFGACYVTGDKKIAHATDERLPPEGRVQGSTLKYGEYPSVHYRLLYHDLL